MRRILAEPERWRKIRGDNRKLNFRRFPYAIVYSLEEPISIATVSNRQE